MLKSQRGADNYTKENGMISNALRDITFDKDGFLWIVTDAGIDRFDGQRFIHFQHDPSDKLTIASNNIQIIQFDNKNSIWASTMNNGIIRINTKTFRVENFRNDPLNKNTVSEDWATAILSDKNGVTWFSPHYKGLDKYFNGKFRNFRPSSQFKGLNPRFCDLFMDIVQDKNDRNILWCASLDGLFAFNKRTEKWMHYPVSKSSFFMQLQLTDLESAMRCIEQDGKGNLYIGTWGGGLLYFDIIQQKYTRYLFQDIIPVSGRRNNIPDLKWRDSRYLYICAAEQDFMLFDTKKKEFIRYNEAEKAIVNPVSIARYKSQIAVAGEFNGLYIQNESIVYGKHYAVPFDLRKMVFYPNGKEWLAINADNRGQVLFHKNGKDKIYSFYEFNGESEFSAIRPVFIRKYGWLIVCSDRVLKFDEKNGLTEFVSFSKSLSQSQLKNAVPISVFNENDSLIWMGTKYGGILQLDLHTKKISVTLHNPVNSDSPAHNSWIYTFAEKDGILYYGFEEGIGAYDLKERRYFVPLAAEFLSRKQVRSIVFVNDQIWAGTEAEGIFIIEAASGRLIKQFTEREGLQTREIYRLVKDRNNNVWVRTATGISIINSQNFKIHSMGSANGVGSVYDILNIGNSIYLPGKNGYIVAWLFSQLPADISPKPYIQRVRLLDGSPFVTGKKVFDYDENNIAFEFGVLDYSGKSGMFVSYRLKGLENQWHSGNNKDEAAYYNLPGGNYEFQVRCFENGKEYVNSYKLRIIPPFWTSWWFIIFCILFIGSTTWFFMKSRIRRIRKQESLRTEFNRQINEMEGKALRAQMNPHFLFNSLNSIRLFILKNQVDSASDYITKFSRLLRMILNHSRQDMITVYDEIQTLKLYLDFERLRFDKGFDCDIEIDGQEVLGYQLPPMIIQPFVENAIWHGLMARQDDGGYVGISFSIQPGRLYVEVRDNGVGREQARLNNRRDSLKEGSVGLEITKDRLRSLTRRTKRLNDYVIEDLYDQNGKPTGTLIKLYFETEEKL